jgi:hypothetical protein
MAWTPTTSRSSRRPPWSTGGDHLRLELRARDVPELDMWAAERNGDLFELEFGRHIELIAVDVT